MLWHSTLPRFVGFEVACPDSTDSISLKKSPLVNPEFTLLLLLSNISHKCQSSQMSKRLSPPVKPARDLAGIVKLQQFSLSAFTVKSRSKGARIPGTYQRTFDKGGISCKYPYKRFAEHIQTVRIRIQCSVLSVNKKVPNKSTSPGGWRFRSISGLRRFSTNEF